MILYYNDVMIYYNDAMCIRTHYTMSQTKKFNHFNRKCTFQIEHSDSTFVETTHRKFHDNLYNHKSPLISDLVDTNIPGNPLRRLKRNWI